jgi:hypothetical protein
MATKTTRTRSHVAIDRIPSVDAGPTTTATTTSRAVAPWVDVPNRRLTDGYLGEAYLVWRCADCGATGGLDAFPAYCPDCRAGRESLYYWTED